MKLNGITLQVARQVPVNAWEGPDMKTKAALKATELAAIATRYANSPRKLKHNPDQMVDRITNIIAKISKLSDVAAGQAKQDALQAAWGAYAKAAKHL
jgi:hypothetical protein